VTPGRAALPLLALAGLCLAISGSATSSSAAGPASDPALDWTGRRGEWLVATRAYEAARWGGSLDGILAALAREAAAESAYIETLARWCDTSAARAPIPTTAGSRSELRAAALDLIERDRLDAALQILGGPLREDPATLPVRARALGLRVAPDSGLALLNWPPDRRAGGVREIRWDALGRAAGDEVEAAYVVAAALSDSADDSRSMRAALWRLMQAPRPAPRVYARLRLVRSLATNGEPLLAAALLERAAVMDGDEELLLANLRADLAAALGDTLAGIRVLIDAGADADLGTAQRYAAAKRALAWTKGARVDSLGEQSWLTLAKSLGDVGEAGWGLSLMERRRASAPDSAAALARLETQAALDARAKRNREAAAAYAALLARRDLPGPSRAKYALGVARAERGLGAFAASDSAFVLATTLDPGSATAGQAAWERAREWEDRKSPREAAAIFAWAEARTRDGRLVEAAKVHRAIAWLRAGYPDSASLSLGGPFEATNRFWWGQIDLARGDSAAALAHFKHVGPEYSWTYEEVRAREELARAGIAPGVAQGAVGSSVVQASPAVRVSTAGYAEAPLQARLLGAAGAAGLMNDALRNCAQRDDDPRARNCTEALEARGIFRVGRHSNVPWPRLDYPPAYARSVATVAERESLSAALLWAIMRQESGYQAAVRSKAGALGLLQLLPSTASRLARTPVTEEALMDPERNIGLGAKYLRDLTREFVDPRAVMAAYNAGEDAVRRWLRERPRVDDIWVELIPYRETRDYVKQVYTAWRRYQAIYAARPVGKG